MKESEPKRDLYEGMLPKQESVPRPQIRAVPGPDLTSWHNAENIPPTLMGFAPSKGEYFWFGVFVGATLVSLFWIGVLAYLH
jgi:hypothetical protein